MNEQIEKLAEQAASNYTQNFKWEYLPEIDKQILEKFAELIVKECIRTIQLGITRDVQTTEKYLRSMRHIKDIKEHFGVE